MEPNELCKVLNQYLAGYSCLFEKDGDDMPGLHLIESAFQLPEEEYHPQLTDPLKWTPNTIILANGHRRIEAPEGWIVDAAIINSAEPIEDGIELKSAKTILRIHKVMPIQSSGD